MAFGWNNKAPEAKALTPAPAQLPSKSTFINGKTTAPAKPVGKYDMSKRLENEPIRDFKERMDREAREAEKAAKLPQVDPKDEKIKELEAALARSQSSNKELVAEMDEEAESAAKLRERAATLYEALLLAYGALQAVKHENGVPHIVGRVACALEEGHP